MNTKAAVLYKTGSPLVIEDLHIPDLLIGQVLVKVLFSGVCHTQLNEIKGLKGEDKYLPHTLGHEGSGIVVEVGEGVTRVQKGDYVVLSWIKGPGLDAPSSHYLKDDEIINSGAISTFNQYAIISENRLTKITTKMPPDNAALLGCAIPTGAGILRNTLKIKEGDTIAIFGVGGIGLSAVLAADLLKCSKIIAVDIHEYKLQLAGELGATHKINSTSNNVIASIKDITNGVGVDYAIESAGVKEVMELAFGSIKDSGTAVIAGNLKHGQKISIDPFDLIKGKKIVGTWGGETKPESDIPFYADAYLSGKLKLGMLNTYRYKLSEINEAFKDLENGKVGRALIDFSLQDC